MVGHLRLVEHAAEAADRDAHAVGAAGAAKLAAAANVRFEVHEHARNTAAGELLGERRQHPAEVGEDLLVAAGTDVGRHEVGQGVFLDVLPAGGGLHRPVILDVHPAKPGLHRLPLLPDLVRREALHDQVGRVEHEHEARMVDPAVDLREQLAGAAHEIRLHLKAEGEIRAVAGLGDLTDLVDRLLEVVLGLGVFRRIEGEAADQLRLEGMRQFAGLGDVFGEILFEGHVGILGAVGLVEQLHLADRRRD